MSTILYVNEEMKARAKVLTKRCVQDMKKALLWLLDVYAHTMTVLHVERSANCVLAKLRVCLRGRSRSRPAHVSSSLPLPAMSFFISLQGFFLNKIQSEGILEANIHCFVWRLVKEKKDDDCACVDVPVNSYTMCVYCGPLLTADAELM